MKSIRVLHRGEQVVDLAAAAEAAARSGFPAVALCTGSGSAMATARPRWMPWSVSTWRCGRASSWSLLGPSGSGKTTLLNLVGGIEEATSASVIIAGTDVAGLTGEELTPYRRDRVGFVFQFFNLVPTLDRARERRSCWRRSPVRDAEDRSRDALERVGLGEVADRFPGAAVRRTAAAGGDRPGAGEGAAAVVVRRANRQPRPRDGRQVLAVLRDLAREGHHTVLLVTHNSAIARMADRVVRLHSGGIAELGGVAAPVEAEELDW